MIKKNQKIILLILFILATAGLSYLLEMFVVLPSFSTFKTNNEKISAEKSKITQINSSTSNLKGQDKEKITNFKNFSDILLPETLDSLHFASLNEVVSLASGVTVVTIQISKGVSKTPAAPASGVGQTNQVASTKVNVTYNSTFDSLLKLIRNWILADRLVGPVTATIGSQSNSNNLLYTISYDLPVSAKQVPARVEENIKLTQNEINTLEKIQNKIVYTATPSAKPLGKPDPFH